VSNRAVSSEGKPSGKGRDVMLLLTVWLESVTVLGLIQETQTDFQDLGKLLFGGVIAAIVFGVGFTFVRLKLRDKKPQTSSFISIAANGEDE
jgi:hypothetical protein